MPKRNTARSEGDHAVNKAISEAEKTNDLLRESREESQRRTRAGSNRRRGAAEEHFWFASHPRGKLLKKATD